MNTIDELKLRLIGTVCSRTLLTWTSMSGKSNWEHACLQMDNILNICCECVWLTKWTNKILLNLWFSASQSKLHTINRWDGISNQLSMAYLLRNTCTKNYWNRTTIVEIIIGGWVVSFFETQCTLCTSWFLDVVFAYNQPGKGEATRAYRQSDLSGGSTRVVMSMTALFITSGKPPVGRSQYWMIKV